MRILVCGGRSLVDSPSVYSILADHIHPWDTVISGGARGADTIAAGFAQGLGCEVIIFKPDWKKYGKAAGPIRNQRMLDEGRPDLVLAFPGGTGTADMVRRVRAAGIQLVEVIDGC